MNENDLIDLRRRLEAGFSTETAQRDSIGGEVASAGQCAAVAAVVREIAGGRFVSTMIDGRSHWFNRIDIDGSAWDLDLTGDQYGREPVQQAAAGSLYPGTRERTEADLTPETLQRAIILARRCGLERAVPGLQRLLKAARLIV